MNEQTLRELLAQTGPATKVDDYDKQLQALQLQALLLQKGLHLHHQRAVIIVEGADAAGKGGLIRRLVASMDPRGFIVHAIGAPSQEEQRQHYLQRFWSRMPRSGQLAIFDRSWYGRVLAERVEHLTPPSRWQQAWQEITEFERQLVDDGVCLIKIFLNISYEEQGERFRQRLTTPDKFWKMTPADFQARRQWADYQQAFADMLGKTHSDVAPWDIIPADDKKAARILALQTICQKLSGCVDISAVDFISPEIQAEARAMFGIEMPQPTNNGGNHHDK